MPTDTGSPTATSSPTTSSAHPPPPAPHWWTSGSRAPSPPPARTGARALRVGLLARAVGPLVGAVPSRVPAAIPAPVAPRSRGVGPPHPRSHRRPLARRRLHGRVPALLPPPHPPGPGPVPRARAARWTCARDAIRRADARRCRDAHRVGAAGWGTGVGLRRRRRGLPRPLDPEP